MLDIKVSHEQRLYAFKLIKKYNFGNRGIADGNQNEQYVGILGQVVLADALNMDRPPGKIGFDGGFDFIINNKKVDVKTMGRTVTLKNSYVHNFIALQKEFDVDYYIFCSYNKRRKTLTIGGYISKTKLFKNAILYRKGTKRYRTDGTFFITKTDLYEIKQISLIPINKLDDINLKIK
jgi:hypothetical protein